MAEPTNVTIPGTSTGYNGLLSVTGYGSVAVRVESIRYGLELMTSQGEAANYVAYYPHAVLDTQFSLSLVFRTWTEREAFNTWMSTYMRKVTTRQISRGSMRVSVPARRFVRSAVPHGTLDYGDDVAQAGKAYRTSVSFSGAASPTLKSSSFQNVRDKTLATFYPAGTQLSGKASLAATIFDTPVIPPGWFGPSGNHGNLPGINND